ncbi:hypothetical protein, partial [Butyrivibrio fibrisolvens]|uniref:hypothetical protein n=1 Tax=Butyrivibrio fibrisolvens TaxID=831 RepID=UPI001A9A364F
IVKVQIKVAHACPDTWLTPHRIGGSAAQEYSVRFKYKSGSILLDNQHQGISMDSEENCFLQGIIP